MLTLIDPRMFFWVDRFNFYSELFELKRENGENLFFLIKIGLACQTCLDNGLQCKHRLDKLPHWKPVERQALINKILQSSPDLADRETRGVVKSSRRDWFEKAWIQSLRDRNPYVFEHNPHVLFMAVDPAGGGNQSDFALCTLGYENSRHVVIFFSLLACFCFVCQIRCSINKLRIASIHAHDPIGCSEHVHEEAHVSRGQHVVVRLEDDAVELQTEHVQR